MRGRSDRDRIFDTGGNRELGGEGERWREKGREIDR